MSTVQNGSTAEFPFIPLVAISLVSAGEMHHGNEVPKDPALYKSIELAINRDII